MAPAADVVCQAGDLQQVGLGFFIGHKAAHAGHAADAALLLQLAQRAVDGHARHAELPHQVVFGRQAVAGGPGTVLDLARYKVFDLLVTDHGRGSGGRK